MRDEGSTAVAEEPTTEQQQETAAEQQAEAEPTAEDMRALFKRHKREVALVEAVAKVQLEMNEQEAVIEEAKGRLKQLTGKRDRLNHELHEEVLGKGDSLFDGVKPEGAPNAEPTPEEDDSWRRVPLANIGLDPKIVEKLEAKELNTIGALADFTSAVQNKITDIPGIGPAAQEKIEAALETYWKNNPRKTKANPANQAIINPFDIGLNIEDIAPKAYPELLKEIEKGAEPKIEAIEIKDDDSGELEPWVNVGGLNPETGEVETLTVDGKPVNRLLPLYTADEFKEAFTDDSPHDDDKVIGSVVKWGRRKFTVGSRVDSILVSVSE